MKAKKQVKKIVIPILRLGEVKQEMAAYGKWRNI